MYFTQQNPERGDLIINTQAKTLQTQVAYLGND